MAIILFEEGAIVDYIPESERAEDDPAIVGIKYVSNGKVNSYSQEILKKARRTKNQDILQRIPQAMQKRQFIENVNYISGFRRPDGTEITSIEEFYDSAPANLITEIIGAMEDSRKLSEGQRKNSQGASDSDSHQAKTEAPSTAKIAPNEMGKPATAETGESSGITLLP